MTLIDRRPRGDRDRGRDAPRRRQARATSRSRSSVTSRSSASRSAPAACAWSRSRGSRNCRPPARPRCATGMVVHTRTEQVKHAQSAVVEFLLVNHPLDCPVCDKGGECPLQDITQGWGPGKSRVIDEKRHFEKPIELSPLVAIDRERCILCYRCVRFSQEVSEDAQLQLLERGDRTFVGTFDDRPYVAPFHGNITDLCPVGALTNYTYRFRARPWDIEQAGSVCTLCPSQCNVSFTVRDEKVKRVIARDNAEVDDGWLCDRGRYGFEMFDAAERVDGPRLKGGAATELGGRRSRRPRAGLKAAGGKVAAIVGDASNEEGYLVQRIAARGARLAARRLAPLARPRPRGAGPRSPSPSSRPRSATSTTPTRSSSSAPTRCTARRSSTCASARRSAATAPSWRSRPSAPDARSTAAPRRSPATRPARPPTSSPSWPRRSAAPRTSPRRWPRPCATPARSSSSGASASAARATAPTRPARPRRRALDLAEQGRLGPAGSPRLRQRPRPARGRLPPRRRPGPDASALAVGNGVTAATEEIRAALESGELKALVLFGVDPLRDFPDTEAWEAALDRRRPRRRLLDASRTRPPPRPTSSSRSRPTPRKTAPSPTPTAACSASAPAPPAPATSAPTGRSSPSSRWPSATTPASTPSPRPSRPSTDAVPFYAGIDRRRHRRPRHPLAGPPAAASAPEPSGRRLLAGRSARRRRLPPRTAPRSRVASADVRRGRRRPRPRAPTATSGPARSPS